MYAAFNNPPLFLAVWFKSQFLIGVFFMDCHIKTDNYYKTFFRLLFENKFRWEKSWMANRIKSFTEDGFFDVKTFVCASAPFLIYDDEIEAKMHEISHWWIKNYGH